MLIGGSGTTPAVWQEAAIPWKSRYAPEISFSSSREYCYGIIIILTRWLASNTRQSLALMPSTHEASPSREAAAMPAWYESMRLMTLACRGMASKWLSWYCLRPAWRRAQAAQGGFVINDIVAAVWNKALRLMLWEYCGKYSCLPYS